MYPPNHHQIQDQQKMITAIKQYPLASLISVIDGKPLISHIPVIFNEETGKLVGHIDKFNPQAESLKGNKEVTLVFKGPDCYISPSVYTTEQLPTWNYIIVHITGKVTAVTHPEKAKQTLVEMATFLEKPEHNYILKLGNPKMEKAINYIHAFENELPRGRAIEVSSGKNFIFSLMKTSGFQTFLFDHRGRASGNSFD